MATNQYDWKDPANLNTQDVDDVIMALRDHQPCDYTKLTEQILIKRILAQCNDITDDNKKVLSTYTIKELTPLDSSISLKTVNIVLYSLLEKNPLNNHPVKLSRVRPDGGAPIWKLIRTNNSKKEILADGAVKKPVVQIENKFAALTGDAPYKKALEKKPVVVPNPKLVQPIRKQAPITRPEPAFGGSTSWPLETVDKKPVVENKPPVVKSMDEVFARPSDISLLAPTSIDLKFMSTPNILHSAETTVEMVQPTAIKTSELIEKLKDHNIKIFIDMTMFSNNTLFGKRIYPFAKANSDCAKNGQVETFVGGSIVMNMALNIGQLSMLDGPDEKYIILSTHREFADVVDFVRTYNRPRKAWLVTSYEELFDLMKTF